MAIFDEKLRLENGLSFSFLFGVVWARLFFPSFRLWIPETVLRFQNGASFFGVVLARLFFPQFRIWITKTVQRNALCRSRWALSNADFLAKFGFDTADHESSKVCHKLVRQLDILSLDEHRGKPWPTIAALALTSCTRVSKGNLLSWI